jgi:nicotinamidase-related amidase
MVEGGALASATPYPWPFHGSFEPSLMALVACLDPRWRIARPESETSDERLTNLADGLRACGAMVIAVVKLPERRPSGDRYAGSSTRLLDPGAIGADFVLTAGASSAFFSSPLDKVLRSYGRTDLILAGWGLEGPVHSTMRAANDRGYECLLVPDASSPLDLDLEKASCEMVRFSGGIFGAYANTSDVLDALL